MVNWHSNVFPGILGRTCDRPCEPACRRGRVEENNGEKPEPVAICRLKRVAADNKGDVKARMPKAAAKKNGKRIACIGAGPASLTVARDLAPLGYQVTVFDQDPRAGGMIWSQIPRFRLPMEVIDEEVGYILDLGVEFRGGTKIASMKKLLAEDYDAIFVGSGAPRGRDLDIPGRKEAAKNIHIGIDWLSSVSFGHTDKIGRSVIVLGGGNAAMDCCRSSRRLGGEDVKVIVRSGFDEMKASPWEKEDAIHEGIPIINYHVPKAFTHENGRLTGVVFEKVEAKKDDQGRRRLVPTGEPDVHFACDDVLIAVGQENAFPWIERDSGVEFDDHGLPVVDKTTFHSTHPRVFFGGDSAFGPKNIIWAVAHGHEAAISIDAFCRDEDLTKRPPPLFNLLSQKMGIHEWSYDNDVTNDARFRVPLKDKVIALKNIKMEVELGFDAARRLQGCGGVKHTVTPIQRVNDFVVKFANVNGSGSASANLLFAKSILRMGVPVAPRNIFPSNIQGLPTWFEVRVNEAGWRGRRGGVDLMVAMNPQTWDQDIKEIEPGGYLFYDSSKALPPSKFRDDIVVIGMPLTEICNREYSDPRQRQLFKNIIYVGALSALLEIEPEAIAELIGELYKGKEALLKPNVQAMRMGRTYAQNELDWPLGIKVRRTNAVGEKVFIEGNSAAALGCVYGGATVAAWYPITPSSSLAEAFARHCRRFRTDPATGKARYAIVQAEDELASIGIVIGATWNGARAFTCTSGPGISLMQEFIGLAYFAEIPAVLFDIQRGSPSTGMPTRTQQADLVSCAYASHGDTKHVLIFPEDPKEAFEFAALSFDLAERLQTPIFVMMDLDVGMQDWLWEPLAWDDSRKLERGKVMSYADLEAGKDFGRYLDVDGDGIAYRTYPGTHPNRGSYFTRGSTKDRYARYTEDGATYVDNMQRLLRKFETAKQLVPVPVRRNAAQRTRFGAIYFRSTGAAMDETLATLDGRGIALDTLRIRAFPFHDEVLDFITEHEQIYVVEQNRDAQMRMLLVNELAIDAARLIPVLHYDGTPITARFILREIGEKLAMFNVTPLRKVAP